MAVLTGLLQINPKDAFRVVRTQASFPSTLNTASFAHYRRRCQFLQSIRHIYFLVLCFLHCSVQLELITMSLLHQGGVSDDVSLTAYITAALLELDAVSPSHARTQALDTSHISIQFSDTRVAHVVKSEHCVLSLRLSATQKDPLVSGCLRCLSSAVSGQLDNMYTMALLSYTFTLAGDQQARIKLLTSLHQQSSTDGMWI